MCATGSVREFSSVHSGTSRHRGSDSTPAKHDRRRVRESGGIPPRLRHTTRTPHPREGRSRAEMHFSSCSLRVTANLPQRKTRISDSSLNTPSYIYAIERNRVTPDLPTRPALHSIAHRCERRCVLPSLPVPAARAGAALAPKSTHPVAQPALPSRPGIKFKAGIAQQPRNNRHVLFADQFGCHQYPATPCACATSTWCGVASVMPQAPDSSCISNRRGAMVVFPCGASRKPYAATPEILHPFEVMKESLVVENGRRETQVFAHRFHPSCDPIPARARRAGSEALCLTARSMLPPFHESIRDVPPVDLHAVRKCDRRHAMAIVYSLNQPPW